MALTLKVGESQVITSNGQKATVKRTRKDVYFFQDASGERTGHARWGDKQSIMADIAFWKRASRLPRTEAGTHMGRGQSRI